MTTATATQPREPRTLDAEQAILRDHLARARRALRLQMLVEFLLDAVALVVAVGAVLIGLDYGLRLGLTARQILLGASVLGVLAVLIIRSLPRLRAARLDDLGLAMTLDRYRPGTGQQVADVLQLPDELDETRAGASPALVRLAVRRASEALAQADWSAHWNHDRSAACALALVGACLVPVGFAAYAPAAARLSVARWLRGSNERWPQRTYLSIQGLGSRNRLLAPRDEAFAVDVRADLPETRPQPEGWLIAGRGEPLMIRRKPEPMTFPTSVRVRERTAEGAIRDAVMTETAPGRYRHELPPSATSSRFELTGGDDWLGPIEVERVDRPTLAAMALRVRDPNASAGAFREIGDLRQHLIFLPDTEIELTLTGSEPLEQLRVDVHPGSAPKVDRIDLKTFVAHLTLREPTTLEIQATSRATNLPSKPTFLSLGMLKDREPRVTLRAQGVGIHVTPVATVPLTLAATDDLGLAALRLQVERTSHAEDKAEPTTEKKTVVIPLAADSSRAILDHQARQDLELQTSPPRIGTILRLQAEADDHCARGTQVGRSGVLLMQVVSPDELFYEILIRQRAERAKFVGAYDTVEKLAPTLASLPSAEDYTQVARTLHAATRQTDQIANRIADSLTEMKLNQVGSPKSHRLLQDGVIDPIRALNSGLASDLRGVLQSLAGGGKASDKDAEKARRMHGDFAAKMKIILDQMSQWESFVDVVNQVAEVIKMQQKVLKETEKARESRTQEIFDEKP